MLTLTRRFPRHYFSRLTCSPRSQLLRYDSLNLCSLNYVIGCGGSLRVPVGGGVVFTCSEGASRLLSAWMCFVQVGVC